MNRDANEPLSPQQVRAWLLFALCAERLNGWNERRLWVSDAHAGEVANVWLARQRLSLPVSEKKHLLALSDAFARHLAGTLSRDAALHVAHEMMEALDFRYQSTTAVAMLEQCEQWLANDEEADG